MNEPNHNCVHLLRSTLHRFAKFFCDYLPFIIYSSNRDWDTVFYAISSCPSKRFILPKILRLPITALVPYDDMTELVQPGEERSESCWYPNNSPFQPGAAPLCTFLVILYPNLMLPRFFL